MWWQQIIARSDLMIRRARPIDAPALARVQVDSWREAYRDLIEQRHLDALSYAAHERQWRRNLGVHGSVFLAVWQGQIVGLASGGRCRSLAGFGSELYLLYVLAAFHGLGIGRALFDVVHHDQVVQGSEDIVAWVLAENHPARAFYERLGGTLAGESSSLVGRQRVKEVAYGWRG